MPTNQIANNHKTTQTTYDERRNRVVFPLFNTTTAIHADDLNCCFRYAKPICSCNDPVICTSRTLS